MVWRIARAFPPGSSLGWSQRRDLARGLTVSKGAARSTTVDSAGWATSSTERALGRVGGEVFDGAFRQHEHDSAGAG